MWLAENLANFMVLPRYIITYLRLLLSYQVMKRVRMKVVEMKRLELLAALAVVVTLCWWRILMQQLWNWRLSKEESRVEKSTKLRKKKTRRKGKCSWSSRFSYENFCYLKFQIHFYLRWVNFNIINLELLHSYRFWWKRAYSDSDC